MEAYRQRQRENSRESAKANYLHDLPGPFTRSPTSSMSTAYPSLPPFSPLDSRHTTPQYRIPCVHSATLRLRSLSYSALLSLLAHRARTRTID